MHPWILKKNVDRMSSNIESQEHCRRLKNEIGYAEHPGGGGIDGLDTFFSIVHCYLGLLLSLQQFKNKVNWLSVQKINSLLHS